MTENLTFTERVFPYANYPFPQDVANDPMVLYHGTSSCFEKDIELNGILVNKIHFSKTELNLIANLFDQIGWAGRKGSLTTLKPYSISHDNERHSVKPIFLERNSYAVIGYAENNGGEIANCIRNCFRDLEDFLNNREIRDEHQRNIQLKIDTHARDGFLYNPPIQKISLEELRKELNKIYHINQRANNLLNETDYGIVYAIKFSENNIKDFLYHNVMGIKYFKDISPNQIVGKAIVPKEYSHDRWNRNFELPGNPRILDAIKAEY